LLLIFLFSLPSTSTTKQHIHTYTALQIFNHVCPVYIVVKKFQTLANDWWRRWWYDKMETCRLNTLPLHLMDIPSSSSQRLKTESYNKKLIIICKKNLCVKTNKC
jgi:hypothetical protein